MMILTTSQPSEYSIISKTKEMTEKKKSPSSSKDKAVDKKKKKHPSKKKQDLSSKEKSHHHHHDKYYSNNSLQTSTSEAQQKVYKIGMLGDAGVGKASLCVEFTKSRKVRGK